MIERLTQRWRAEAGYRQLLKIAFPLILSSGSISILLFVDRMLLSWDSTENIAAVLPAGILNWALLCPFFGTALYTSTFIAQYVGAGRSERVGAALWQGLYVAAIGGAMMPLLAPFADSIFAFIGHAPEVQKLEATYFRILNFSSIFFLANTVFSCFYSGRGRAWAIVWVNIVLTLLNTVFDYALIFGRWGFPAMGIEGAGWATMASSGLVTLLYAYLVMRDRHNAIFKTRSAWRFEKDLFRRVIRFGAPSGIHFFLDVMGITVFMLLIGRLGILELASTNITHQIHLLGLLPLVGLGIATSVVVGQYQGAGSSRLAEKATYSALQMAIAYNVAVSCSYLLVPELFIEPFLLGRDPADPSTPALIKLSSHLLIFVAGFTLFESLAILSSAALKGAGDTAFIMKVLAITSLTLMIGPSYLVIEILELHIYWAWACLFLNLAIVSLVFFLRFRSRRWQSIRILE